MFRWFKNSIKNVIDQIKYRETYVTGEITANNGDGTYDVKINSADTAYKNVETRHYNENFSVGQIVDIGYEYGNKESPKILGPSKKIPQEPKQVDVDYSTEEGAGKQTVVMVPVYSGTADGSVCDLDADYDTCHAKTVGDLVNDTDNFVAIGYFYDTVVGPGLVHAIYRSFLSFDTSAIPVGVTITSAILYIYKWDAGTNIDTEFDLVIQDGQPTYPHSTLVVGDYNRDHYHNNGGSINTASISSGAYTAIPLNDNGKKWINKGGLTKFCLRNSREIAGLGSAVDPYYEALAIYSSEKGEGYKPKLVITYEI